MSAERLVGGWRLVGWDIVSGDGRTSHPFGDAPEGMIVYTADGAMSALIAEAGRAPLSAPSMKSAPEAERAAAFSSFFAYGGTFVVEGDTVVHRVTVALNPAFVGTEQRRSMAFDGAGGLTLSASEPDGKGGTRRHAIRWRRA